MSVLSQRATGYKAGLLLLSLGCLTFILGFSSANWMECSMMFEYLYPGHQATGHGGRGADFSSMSPSVQPIGVHAHTGLWAWCLEFQHYPEHNECGSNDAEYGWVMGVWVLQGLALSSILASLVYAVLVNCVFSRPTHSRLVEVVAFLAGLLGFVGVLVFMVRASKEHNEAMATLEENMHMVNGYCHVSWSFAVDVCGCVLSFLAAIVVAAYNQSLSVQVVPREERTCPAARRARATRANDRRVTQSNTVNPSPHNPITIVPPQPGTPITNVQVFYVPHAGQLPATTPGPSSMLPTPPAYDTQYPQPGTAGKPLSMASHLVPMGSQAVPCSAYAQAAGGGDVPHAGLPSNYPTKPIMGMRPPDYDVQYPPPGASQSPITPPPPSHPVPLISTQTIPSAQYGQDGNPLPAPSALNPASLGSATPPAYDVQYLQPPTNQPPSMVSHPVSPMATGVQAIPCAPAGQGEDGSTAAAVSSEAPAASAESPTGPADE